MPKIRPVSTFVKVMQKKPWPLFFRARCSQDHYNTVYKILIFANIHIGTKIKSGTLRVSCVIIACHVIFY